MANSGHNRVVKLTDFRSLNGYTMLIAFMPAFALAHWFATPVEGNWDFAPARGSTQAVGRVVAVTENSITITHTVKKLPVTVYPFHNRLAMGSFNLLEPDGNAYCRNDAKLGDLVVLRILKIGKIDYCISFGICERPDGKVPPCRRYWVGQYQPYHQVCEAARACNERQVPLPYHLYPLTRSYNFPAFDPGIPKGERLKPFPEEHPFSYVEWVLFLR